MEHFGIFTILEQRFHSNCRQQIKLKLQKAEENLTLLQKDLFLVFFWQKMQIGKLKAGQNVRNVLKCVFPKCIAVQNKNQWRHKKKLKTGGKSWILEEGKTLMMFLVNQSPRGCQALKAFIHDQWSRGRPINGECVMRF